MTLCGNGCFAWNKESTKLKKKRESTKLNKNNYKFSSKHAVLLSYFCFVVLTEDIFPLLFFFLPFLEGVGEGKMM